MTPENFCYWLQGSLEILSPAGLTSEQVTVIKDHLQLVFDKQTPVRESTPLPRTTDFLDEYVKKKSFDSTPFIAPPTPFYDPNQIIY